MHGDLAGQYEPIVLLYDDPAHRRMRIRGVPVLRGPADLPAVMGTLGPDDGWLRLKTHHSQEGDCYDFFNSQVFC
jgi:hypothetical protein